MVRQWQQKRMLADGNLGTLAVLRMSAFNQMQFMRKL
jgi:hypothetical protein